ncbi:hypothetical protein N7494_006990 [Penicillium frequentans]|uniref:Uncharacterized protein n=1 Tax=Penicillium frequentans TaxID=3151616 RepID=A0AAD6CRM1_9EURO|nr:hypothetical protein N7494_006990 [Penicillium glabrum]
MTGTVGPCRLQSDLIAEAEGNDCPAQLLLSSFGQQGNFTHYQYRLLLWVPISTSVECVDVLRQKTSRLAQEVYEREFRVTVRHDFIFQKEDVEVITIPSYPNNKKRPLHIDSHAPTRTPGARQTHSKDYSSPSRLPSHDSEELVRQSYVQAQKSKTISFTRIPRRVTVTGVGIGRYDPFEIQPHHFKNAQLDENKSKQIIDIICAARSVLPKAVDWSRYAQEHSFDAESVDKVIVEAFCSDASSNPDPIRMTVTDLGCGLLKGSRRLKSKNLRAAKLAKLLGCAVMCVSEYIEGGFKQSAGILNRKMAAALEEVPGVQKRSRNIARYFCWMASEATGWKGRSLALYFLLENMGRERLYRLFSITNPAPAAELVNLLNSSEYSTILPDADTAMDVIEIVKHLLGGTVEDLTICNALGYHVDALAKCLSPPIDYSQEWLQYFLRQIPRHQPTLIHVPTSSQSRLGPIQESHDQNVANHDDATLTECLGEQRPMKSRREDHRMTGSEYNWDNGPLEIFPFSFHETDFYPDKGSYNAVELLGTDDTTFEFF